MEPKPGEVWVDREDSTRVKIIGTDGHYVFYDDPRKLVRRMSLITWFNDKFRREDAPQQEGKS